MEIKEIAFNNIDCIESPWEEYNDYHRKKARFFSIRFKQKTFAKKKKYKKLGFLPRNYRLMKP